MLRQPVKCRAFMKVAFESGRVQQGWTQAMICSSNIGTRKKVAG